MCKKKKKKPQNTIKAFTSLITLHMHLIFDFPIFLHIRWKRRLLQPRWSQHSLALMVSLLSSGKELGDPGKEGTGLGGGGKGKAESTLDSSTSQVSFC